ncbi:MAG: leishmanolysin-related zinc metalloendopeptidase [Gemmatimonadota bacterium]|nr:leishmanolysin-related zinc metalloendopeptidase [Gemmatimonadota bacterium]
MAVAASVSACEDPFGPVVDPEYSIDLRYWGDPPGEEQQARIASAVARWEGLIMRGLPPAFVEGDAGCGVGAPEMDEEVDDLVVFVRVIDIGALAESGPCLVRSDGGLPITATVWLDGPGRLSQLDPDFLESLVTHELGHALGFGTIWEDRALLREPSLSGGAEPHFAGTNAIAAFNAAGGLGFDGKKVPVETAGGHGTADSHWSQMPFGNELMTATVLPGPNPLSRVTAASMIDLGYEIDLEGSDDYVIPGADADVAPARAPAELPPLTESAPRWPITAIDRRGAVVRRIRPGTSSTGSR